MSDKRKVIVTVNLEVEVSTGISIDYLQGILDVQMSKMLHNVNRNLPIDDIKFKESGKVVALEVNNTEGGTDVKIDNQEVYDGPLEW